MTQSDQDKVIVEQVEGDIPNPSTDQLTWAIHVAKTRLSARATIGNTSLHTDALIALVAASEQLQKERLDQGAPCGGQVEEARAIIARLRATPLTAATVCKARFDKSDVFGLAKAYEDLAARIEATRPRSSSEGVEGRVTRITGHSLGLLVNERYDPTKPSDLTNADAVSYGKFLAEIAEALSYLQSLLEEARANIPIARAAGFKAGISAAESRVHYLTARDDLSPHIKALKDVGAEAFLAKLTPSDRQESV